MELLERQAIEWQCSRLICHYANLNDEARWDEVANLFAEDGVLFRPSEPEQPIAGRVNILAEFRIRPPRITRHVCSNIVVDVESPILARATSAMVLYTGEMQLIGGFKDELVWKQHEWRFKERRGFITFRK